jgi:hypothetical protein
MTHKNVATVLTDDTDIITFGSKSMLKMIQLQFIDVLKELFNDFLEMKPDQSLCYSISDMMIIVNKKKYYTCVQNRVNINFKYDVQTIYEFGTSDVINFAVEYDRDSVFQYLKDKANDILRLNEKALIDVFTQDNFIEMCILFGSDYQQKICDMTVGEIFEAYILSDMCIEKCIEYIESKKNIKISIDYIETFNSIKEYYHKASVINPEDIDYNIYKINECELFKYLANYGFPYARVSSSIKLYKNDFNNILYELNKVKT